MKRSKLVTTVVACALSACCVGAFAACGDNGETDAPHTPVAMDAVKTDIVVCGYEWGPAIPKVIVEFKGDVSGVTKGRGFTGVIKRWNHHRLKMTHGTGPVHRSVGSTGANSNPSRRIKNLKMPGQYGHENVTIQNLKVVKVDKARGVLLIRGAVPGPKGGLVTVKETVK